MTDRIVIPRADDPAIEALWQRPAAANSILVLAHGAGAGMEHRFMVALADALADQHVATLRFEFPYMTARRRRPDPPARLTAAVAVAVEFANSESGGLPVYAGGKSLGGRMTSTAASTSGLVVKGLVFFGFPLHAPGREGVDRANHLFNVDLPLLFLQGTRDKLAERTRIGEVCRRLGERDASNPARAVSLVEIDEADHSFHVPKRTGKTDAEVIQFLAATTADWMGRR